MKNKNILVITQWGYREGLIQSYTLPYLKIIHAINPGATIYLVTQEKTGLEKNQNDLRTIKQELLAYNIVLVPEKYHRAGAAKYFFLAINFLKHLLFIFSKGVKHIHTFCTPAGGYGYILSKFSGRPLIVDSYEPHSEYMLDCGVWKEDQFAFKVLNILEKKQAQRAKYLIAATRAIVGHSEKKFGIDISPWDVKPACVDLERFSFHEGKAKKLREQLQFADKIVCVYAGKFGDFYLKEEVFEFYKVAFDYWKERFHVLLLSDITATELDEYCHQFQLNRSAFTLVMAPHNLVPDYLSASDFGLSPYRPTFSKKFCTPIKNGEYWAVGLPVVITKNISIDSDLIEQNNIGYVLKELNTAEYLKAVYKIDELLNTDRAVLRNAIRRIAENNRSYAIAETIYKKIYQ